MSVKSFLSWWVTLLLLALAGGCGKSKPKEQTAEQKVVPPAQGVGVPFTTETAARIHWIGMKRLAARPDAAYFMTIWNLPETDKLKNQTLDKLALWLAKDVLPPQTNQLSTINYPPSTNSQPSTSSPPSTNSPLSTINSPLSTSPLRPLLDDLLAEEFYLEVRTPTNQPSQLALAIRLDEPRADSWRTNLQAFGSQLTNQPSTIHHPSSPSDLALARAGDWTFLGFGAATNTALAELMASLQMNRQPFPAHETNSWFELDCNPRLMAGALSLPFHLPEDAPIVALAVSGDGREVQTSGRLYFPKPLQLELEPWQIPTNLIGAPLFSFTAVGGIRPWLAQMDIWKTLQAKTPPNQFLSWSQPGGEVPFFTFCAMPLADASNVVGRASERLWSEANPWLATNSVGKIERSTNFNGCRWIGVPFCSPFLRSVNTSGREFLVSGMMPLPFTNPPPPAELFRELTIRTNLIYYDWEFSGPRVTDWIHISQLARVIFGKAQLPGQGAGMSWVAALGPKLGNSVSSLTISGPDRLSFGRRSSMGLTAMELNLLADWLESSQFPRGLYTFLGPSRPFRRPPSAIRAMTTSTNSAPSSMHSAVPTTNAASHE